MNNLSDDYKFLRSLTKKSGYVIKTNNIHDRMDVFVRLLRMDFGDNLNFIFGTLSELKDPDDYRRYPWVIIDFVSDNISAVTMVEISHSIREYVSYEDFVKCTNKHIGNYGDIKMCF